MSKNKGMKFDQNKAPLHMIPEEALIGMAEAFNYGAQKYERFNYRKGLEFSRLTDSLRRHTLSFLANEDLDPESGLHHTKHILANAAMLEYMRIHKPEMDDRYKPDANEEIETSTEDQNTFTGHKFKFGKLDIVKVGALVAEVQECIYDENFDPKYILKTIDTNQIFTEKEFMLEFAPQ